MDTKNWWHKSKKQTDRGGLIQFCVDEFKYKRYLEIGLGQGHNFAQIKCEEKVGVEKSSRRITALTESGEDAIFFMTSDAFFEQYKGPGRMRSFDIIFVDGGHSYDPAMKDIYNSLDMLTENGVVLVHDALPKLGGEPDTVWRAMLELRTRPEFDFIIGDFRFNAEGVKFGPQTSRAMGIVINSPNTDLHQTPYDYDVVMGMSDKEVLVKDKDLFRLRTRKEVTTWLCEKRGEKELANG